MALAKYFEDNMEIIEERMRSKAPKEEMSMPVLNIEIRKKMNETAAKKNNYAETRLQASQSKEAIKSVKKRLELRFYIIPGADSVRQLQMNGWRWNKSEACWTNLNSEDNVRFVLEHMHNFSLKALGTIVL